MVSIEEIAPDLDELDVEDAVDETGFGMFNIKVAIICGLIYMNTGLSIGSVGFILPSAGCDLQLSTGDKGQLGSASLLGMLIGSYFWGCFADVLGRKLALLYALFGYAVLEIISSGVSIYWLFLTLKFFSGWAINGQTLILFTYLGEFQCSKYREKILCWMEMAWTIGLIILPLMAWVVIPLDFSYTMGKFLFRSWNLFIVACAMPSLLIGFWLLFFPETPKYLAAGRRDKELARALETMFKQNTGGNFDEYLDNLSKNGYDRMRKRLIVATHVARNNVLNPENINEQLPIARSTTKRQSFVSMLRRLVLQSGKLFKSTHRRNTLLLCGLIYCIASSYYALMLWFPELFQRFAQFEVAQPNETSSLCKISAHNRTMFAFEETTPSCPSTVDQHVYLHTLILGLACLPVSIILPLCVHKLGYKFYLIVSTMVAALVILGLNFVTSSTQNLILSCLFEAFSSVCMSIVFCLVVDLFPTNLRAFAAALSAFFGRLGALIGNNLLGYLIDDYCTVAIGVIAAQLSLAMIMSCFILRKSNTSNQ